MKKKLIGKLYTLLVEHLIEEILKLQEILSNLYLKSENEQDYKSDMKIEQYTHNLKTRIRELKKLQRKLLEENDLSHSSMDQLFLDKKEYIKLKKYSKYKQYN